MPVQKHTHKYILRNFGTKEKPRKLYACSLSNCSHFMPTIAQVIGKETVCWQCGEKTIVDLNMIRQKIKKPRCYKCREKTKLPPDKVKETEKLDSAIDLLLSNLKGNI